MTVLEQAAISGSTSIMEALRKATMTHHAAAEHHAFQRELAKGQAPIKQYAAFLGQLLFVHRALWTALTHAATDCPQIAGVLEPWQDDEPRILEDLAHFGVDADALSPFTSTSTLVAQINEFGRTNPIVLLGHHYVLEGAKNGGRFIAMNLRRAYNLQDNNGTRYLDPYNDEQRARWQSFKDDMEAQFFAPDDRTDIIASSCSMFEAIAGISDDLLASAR